MVGEACKEGVVSRNRLWQLITHPLQPISTDAFASKPVQNKAQNTGTLWVQSQGRSLWDLSRKGRGPSSFLRQLLGLGAPDGITGPTQGGRAGLPTYLTSETCAGSSKSCLVVICFSLQPVQNTGKLLWHTTE